MANGGGGAGFTTIGCSIGIEPDLPFLACVFFGGGGNGGCSSSFHLLNARPIGSNAFGSNVVRCARSVIAVGEFVAMTAQRRGPSRGIISIRQSPLATTWSPTSRSSQYRAGRSFFARAIRHSADRPSIALT